MRRAMLLLVGVGAGGWALWMLLSGAGMGLPVEEPSLPVMATVDAPAGEMPKPVFILLPMAIDGTDLVAEVLAEYEGPFWEDGTGDEVAGVAALVLRNLGEETVRFARVVLERGGLELVFDADWILPGQAVLVPERQRKTCPEQDFSDCYGWSLPAEGWHTPEEFSVTDAGMDSVRLTNSAEKTLPGLRLVYKSYDRETGLYIGGAAHEAEVAELKPGETREVFLDRYAKGYSRVLGIRIPEE